MENEWTSTEMSGPDLAGANGSKGVNLHIASGLRWSVRTRYGVRVQEWQWQVVATEARFEGPPAEGGAWK